MVLDTCEEAVYLLSKLQITGQKTRGDAAYLLAAQLLAAQLNVAAGVTACQPEIDGVIDEARLLLASEGFDGTGGYFMRGKGNKGDSPERTLALELAQVLDDYNNGICPVVAP